MRGQGSLSAIKKPLPTHITKETNETPETH